MSETKKELAVTPIVFRVDQDIQDYIENEMIRRKQFNKSLITREIFLMGLELYKQNKK